MEQLVNFIIRPPRADYSLQNDLLEPTFMLKGRWFQRKDLEVKNGKGLILQCSHYTPLTPTEGKALPCVIYCHGNSGCRADASEAAIILLPSNITVFTLDFSGSGLSEGEHVTLGWNEKEDLKAVVNHLRNDGNVSCIGLWGRSMGAVTSLMYGAEDPSIAGMVLDSPFSNLVDLMMELVDTYKYPLPKFTVKLAIQHMRRIIKKKANFDIMELDTIKVAKCSFVPALFGHATDDDFIHPRHSDRICDAYIGDKNIIKFDGDHNSPRPQFYFDSITIFFHNVLSPPMDDHYYDPMNDYFIEDNWEAIHDLEYRNNHLPVLPLERSATSTEDAINQVRLRRPMSRMEVPSDVPHREKTAEVEENGCSFDLCPSSSGTNLDTCNGSDSLFVPNASSDRYLEYSFGSVLDMPDSVEDEERMLMEAVMMSLKEFSPTDGGEQTSIVKNATSPTDGGELTSIANNATSLGSSNCMRIPDSQAMCSSTLENDAMQVSESASTDNANCKNDLSGSSESSSGASSSKQESDVVVGTQARLVVQKNTPSNNILDGLAQKWGNFFRSSG